jgi:hypothetical protein
MPVYYPWRSLGSWRGFNMMAEGLRDQFAHDARLAAIRTFKSNEEIHEKWMKILLLSADNENRKQKLKATTDKFREINGNNLRTV